MSPERDLGTEVGEIGGVPDRIPAIVERRSAGPRVRIVVESDAAETPEDVLRSILADVVLAVNGRISVTGASVAVDGVELPR